MDALLDFISRIRNLNFYHAIHPILSTVAKPSVVKSTTQNTNNVYAYGSEQEDKGFIEWIKWLHEPVRPIYLDYLRYKRDVEED